MKVIMYLASSVDGHIARANDSTPWSAAEWKQYYSTVKKAGCTIIGHRTYDIMRGAPLAKLKNVDVIVLSKRHPNCPEATARASSPRAALALAKKMGHKQVIVGGGAITNTSFLRSNLIDELILDIEPQLFGTGVSIAITPMLKNFKLLGTKRYGKDSVQLRYKFI